jgi:hypothetical protein
MVAPDAEKVVRVIEANKLFEVDEKSESWLAAYLGSDPRFVTSNKRGGRHITRAGEGI